ncbi:MAG: hypothetical protein R3A12_17410 [Ignavibacteria bacterium]
MNSLKEKFRITETRYSEEKESYDAIKDKQHSVDVAQRQKEN